MEALAALEGALMPSAASLSLSALLAALLVRVALLCVTALLLRALLTRAPWLPLLAALLALAHWHAAVRALGGCVLRGDCLLAALAAEASALRVVDAAAAVALRVAHVLVLVHEYALPYWPLYLFGALTVGGVSFWHLHALFLAVDVQARVQQPRRALWAADLLAWLELGALLSALAASAPLLSSPSLAALLAALPLPLPTLLRAGLSGGVRAVHVEQALAALPVLAWFVPRVRVRGAAVLTWALRVVIVSTCALNVTLALSLAITALRVWPLSAETVPTVGVYGLVR
jgi:hypothetical protein